ncbi:carbonic anhydrase, partial [Acinetobacter baumannii]
MSAADQVEMAAQTNVVFQIENLKTHPAVAERLARRELNVHGWTYKIETGEILSYQAKTGQFIPV